MRTRDVPFSGLSLQARRVEAFRDLDDSVLAVLLDGAVVMEFDRGEVLLEEDAPAEHFFALLSGQAKIVHRSGNGREHLIHVVTPGTPVGLSAMFRQRVYPATAVAAENCLVLRVTRAAVTAAVRADTEFALKILGVMSLRQRMFVKKMSNHGVSAIRRVARYVVHRVLIEDSTEIRLKVSREEWANMLGVARETLSRVLARLVAEGVLDVKGREVSVRQMEKLKALSGMDREKEKRRSSERQR